MGNRYESDHDSPRRFENNEGYDHRQIYVEQMRSEVNQRDYIRYNDIDEIELGYSVALILQFEDRMPKLITGILVSTSPEEIILQVNSKGIRKIISTSHITSIQKQSYKNCEAYASSGDFRSWKKISLYL